VRLDGLPVSLLAGAALGACFLWATRESGLGISLAGRYAAWWDDHVRRYRLHRFFARTPVLQLAGFGLAVVLAITLESPVIAVGGLLLVLLPPLGLVRHRANYEASVSRGLDVFLIGLADALATRPNLADALSGMRATLEQPIKGEVEQVLRDVRLGRCLDDALECMARRLRQPGLDAVVGAALLGRRAGGDLSSIFRQMADMLREMSRLEGVIRTKTAEGRAQAWVMGAVPPGLVVVLDQIDPNWLAPLWNDPFGWGLLGAVAILEVAAIALIRKIIMVDI
jgi:tight adherence protein B